jgi:hypothetical protein
MALWPRIDFAFLCCRFLSLLRIVGVHSNSIRHECITNLPMGPVEQSFRLAKAASKVHLARYAIDKFLLEVAAKLAPGCVHPASCKTMSQVHHSLPLFLS